MSISPSTRIASIDHLRGYAILGMIFVNCMGHFDRTPWLFHHHREGMSYSDTIAPLFIFVVGMGFRLSFKRSVGARGFAAAARRAARRYLVLTAIGFAVYIGWWWDALTDIGLAGLLALPVMHRGAWPRAALGVAALATFQGFVSFTPYGVWGETNSVNGGPLGPLPWCFILLNGTLAWDLMASGSTRAIVAGCLSAGALLVAAGYGLHVPWAHLKETWPFSQYTMIGPYPLVSTGLCWWTLLLFQQCCDRGSLRLPALTLLGKNPLVLYLLQLGLIGVMQVTAPRDAGWPVIIACFTAIYGLCHLAARTLDHRGIVVKL